MSPDTPGANPRSNVVVDPTANVKDLVFAESRRQDDLRQADKVLSDTKHANQTEVAKIHSDHESQIGQLREDYQAKIQKAESGRLDSIRQVDREEVAKTAVAANNAITTLAKQTTDLQQTLAKQVTDTAAAQEARYSSQMSDFNKRVSALELSGSEGKGKQLVTDPAMERLVKVVEELADKNKITVGKAEGISMSAAIILGFITLLSMLSGITATLYTVLHH